MAERPDVFHWDFAVLEANRDPARAMVLGLALVSGQLDRLIEAIEAKGPIVADVLAEEDDNE